MSGLLHRIGAWPTTIKIPLIVAALMIAVGAAISNQVLVRVSDTQHRHLEKLTETYLDGLSSAVEPYVLRDDIWEIFDQLDRARQLYVGLRPLNTIVAAPDGTVLAASDPRRFPTREAIPQALERRFEGGTDLVLDEAAGSAFTRRALSSQGRPVGWVFAEIDIRDLLVERRDVLVALVLTNAALTLLLAGFGYLAVRRMIRPIGVLARHLDRGRDGRIEPIPEPEASARHGELGRLFRRYNALVEALGQREALAARLAEEEKLASLGRLVSGMAHEINNPLGGMFNAIDTIERHDGDPAVRRASLDIVKRGLVGIRDVVRATLVTYKSGGSDRRLRPTDLDDLRFLVRPEVARRGVTLAWRNELPEHLEAPAGPIRQAVLNLLLNACAASPAKGRVELTAAARNGAAVIAISDPGPGMPPEVAAILESGGRDMGRPAEGRGLGAWMVGHLIGELGGQVRVMPRAGGGTRIEITVPLPAKTGATRGELRHVA